MKKKICFLLAFVLLIGLVPAVTTADGTDPSLDIVAYNVVFGDSVYLKYAVSAENADTVQLLLWSSAQDEYVAGTQTITLNSNGKETVKGLSCDVFTYNGLATKQMTDYVYARAYTVKDGIAYYSKATKYSILQYAYNKTGKTGTATTNAKFLNLLNKMLEYGAAAQEYFNYRADHPANADFYQIKVEEGTLSDGFEKGLYLTGENATIIAPETNTAGDAFNHWENSAGAVIGTSATMSVTVGNSNEVYTAKYSDPVVEKPTPSEGLEIEEGVVVGLGTCTDDFVVLPDEYEGTAVTGIDAGAFSGEEFTSIYIPVTITSIGRRAFNASAVTVVYYEGTEEQWNEIVIAAGNTELSNATIYFNSYGPAPAAGYTVTFMDYDGSIIGTQTVAEGSDAELPAANPTRAGYTFAKWTGNYKKVTSDRTISAVYYEGAGSAFIVGDAYVSADGTQVSIPVYANITSGITTAKIRIDFGDKLSLTGVTPGTTFSALIGAQSYPVSNHVTLNWNSGTSNVSGYELFATLLFDASALASETAAVTLTYDEDDVCNTAFENVPFKVVNGSVVAD